MSLLARIWTGFVVVAIIASTDQAMVALHIVSFSTTALSGGLLMIGLALCWIYIPQFLPPRILLLTGGEIGLSLLFLYVPVFLATAWVSFNPADLNMLGFSEISTIGFVLLTFLATSAIARPDTAMWLGRIALLVYLGSMIFDVAMHGILTTFAARAAGFLSNPNGAAYQIVALTIMGLPWNRPSLRATPWSLLGFLGVAGTLSRSGLMAWLLVYAMYLGLVLFTGSFRQRAATLVTLSLAGFAASSVLAIPTGTFQEYLSSTTVTRIQEIKSLAEGKSIAPPDDPRRVVYRYWISKTESAPILGYGSEFSLQGFGPIGHNYEGPHNMFLARYIDSGILGEFCLLTFLCFWFALFMAYRYPRGIVFILLAIEAFMFSHNAVDTRAYMCVLGPLAGDALVRARRDGISPILSASVLRRFPKSLFGHLPR